MIKAEKTKTLTSVKSLNDMAVQANANVSELTDTVSTIDETVTTISSNVSDLQTEVELSAKQEQLDTMDELVRQYIGEEGYVYIAGSTLMIGVGDFKTAITPEQIVFYDGDDVVSYISNKKMYISQTEVVQEQRMGDFVWRPREGGRMSLMYAPEQE